MLNELKRQVLAANLSLPAYGLVTFTWGNVSAIDRQSGLVVIKPSGIAYEAMTLEGSGGGGSGGQGARRASQTLVRHRHPPGAVPRLRRYRRRGAHPQPQRHHLGAGRAADPALGTTHADYFYGDIPCTRPMSEAEIAGDYEGETGKVIIETFNQAGRDPQQVPGVLVYSHGPFAWGKDAADAVHNAVVLEEVAIMAMATRQLAPAIAPMQPELLDKHFLRKHGKHAYYGQ